MFDLRGRVAIITGGTRGIGRALAEGLVLAGAQVVGASRKPDVCAATADELTALGACVGAGEAHGVATHMGDLDAIDALVCARPCAVVLNVITVMTGQMIVADGGYAVAR